MTLDTPKAKNFKRTINISTSKNILSPSDSSFEKTRSPGVRSLRKSLRKSTASRNSERSNWSRVKKWYKVLSAFKNPHDEGGMAREESK